MTVENDVIEVLDADNVNLVRKVVFYEKLLGKVQDIIYSLEPEQRRPFEKIYKSIRTCHIKSAYFWR